MRLPSDWATPGDFATLFQYLWHRDFPIDPGATGARRVDWTIHIGVVVRAIADLMGLLPRFERGGRKDAIIRSTEGDEIAVEWEWGGVWGNELQKLKAHRSDSSDHEGPHLFRPVGVEKRPLAYATLITYTHEHNVQRVQEHVSQEWRGAECQLLLILIIVEESKRYSSGKDFKRMQSIVFAEDGRAAAFKDSPATPWSVPGTRWSTEHIRTQERATSR